MARAVHPARRGVVHHRRAIVREVGQASAHRRPLHDPHCFATAHAGGRAGRVNERVSASRQVHDQKPSERSGKRQAAISVADRHFGKDLVARIDGEVADHLLGGLLRQELGPRVITGERELEEAQVDIRCVLLGAGLDQIGGAVAIEPDPQRRICLGAGLAGHEGNVPGAGHPIVGLGQGHATVDNRREFERAQPLETGPIGEVGVRMLLGLAVRDVGIRYQMWLDPISGHRHAAQPRVECLRNLIRVRTQRISSRKRLFVGETHRLVERQTGPEHVVTACQRLVDWR